MGVAYKIRVTENPVLKLRMSVHFPRNRATLTASKGKSESHNPSRILITMPLTFYFAPMSTANVTVDVLAELEHSLSQPLASRVQLDLKAGDTRTAHYLTTVNPNGCVPALVHDGISIWESAAITIYLGELFGVDSKPASLYPAPGPRRGEAMKWIVWSSTVLAPVGHRLMALHSATGDETERKKVNEDLDKMFQILDGALEGKEFLLGEQYTLADTHLHCFVGYLVMVGADIAAWTNVKEWIGRVSARPAIQKAAE